MTDTTKVPAKAKLPKIKVPSRKFLLALARYYLNRSKSKRTLDMVSHDASNYAGRETTDYRVTEGIKWDKEADLAYINSCLPDGWSYAATAGTFSVGIPHKSYKSGYYTVTISGSNFMEFLY